jgi:hypothetical protein
MTTGRYLPPTRCRSFRSGPRKGGTARAALVKSLRPSAGGRGRGRPTAYAAPMSIVVTPEELGSALADFSFAYLLTVGDDLRARVVAVNVDLVDGTLVVTDTGRGARASVSARPAVTLVWPPTRPGGMSLILDGEASLLDDEAIAVPAGRAILHRPAPDRTAAAPAD